MFWARTYLSVARHLLVSCPPLARQSHVTCSSVAPHLLVSRTPLARQSHATLLHLILCYLPSDASSVSNRKEKRRKEEASDSEAEGHEGRKQKRSEEEPPEEAESGSDDDAKPKVKSISGTSSYQSRFFAISG